MESINASDFKARCLAILDRVQATGERVVILKRGRPIGELQSASRTHAQYPQSELKRYRYRSGRHCCTRSSGRTLGKRQAMTALLDTQLARKLTPVSNWTEWVWSLEVC